jgi:hypothetical protein
MASELIVQTLKGPTTGANANKVLLGSGQELYAPGHVVQVEYQEATGTVTVSTTSFQSIFGTPLSITSSSTSSKFLINVHAFYDWGNTNDNSQYGYLIKRNGTSIDGFKSGYSGQVLNHSNSTGINMDRYFTQSFQFLDAPNTTGTIEYDLQIALRASYTSNSVQFNRQELSRITVMEIAG